MKRILMSLAASIIFITLLFILVFILEEVFSVSEEKTAILTIPVKIPSYIYYDVLHLREPHNDLVLVPIILAALIFNLILYSSIFYLAFTLFAQIRRKPKIEGIETPPDPPIFN